MHWSNLIGRHCNASLFWGKFQWLCNLCIKKLQYRLPGVEWKEVQAIDIDNLDLQIKIDGEDPADPVEKIALEDTKVLVNTRLSKNSNLSEEDHS